MKTFRYLQPGITLHVPAFCFGCRHIPDSQWPHTAKCLCSPTYWFTAGDEKSRRGHQGAWCSSLRLHSLLARGVSSNTQVQGQMISPTSLKPEMKFSSLNQWLGCKSQFFFLHTLTLNCLKTLWFVREGSWRKLCPNLWFPFMVLSDIKPYDLVLGITSWPACGSKLSTTLVCLMDWERSKEP